MTPLTPRQKLVMRLIADGWPYKQIASELGIAEQGVQKHVNRIKAAIPVISIADITQYALATGIAQNRFGKLAEK